jgi:hypothetical protein
MLKLPTLTIVDRTSGAVVGNNIRFADTALARLIGLLGAAELRPGEGLLLAPSSGIHTFGMTYPIDVIALDRSWRVRRLWRKLLPWQVLCPSPVTSCVLELPPGRIEELGIHEDHQLAVMGI